MAVGIGLAVLGLYIVYPVTLGIAAVFPGRDEPGPAPQGFQEVRLQVADGVELAGWYKAPENSAAILLLHGAGGSRAALRPYAQMLTQRGYGVLALDLRGHGASGGKTNRLGWEGTPDVAAGLNYLLSQPGVEQIGGLGLSMGGEVLLGAASTYPEIAAIAADGATRRCTQELLALPSERPLVRNFTARVFFTTVQLLSGTPPPEPLLESMVAARETRYLLIAGGAETQEVAFNELFTQTLNGRVELWVAPQASHTGAFNLYPQEYEQRLITFFDSTLLAAR